VRSAFLLEGLRLDPLDVDADLVGKAAVIQRFVQRLIGILVARVLADDVDRQLALGILDAVDELFPRLASAIRSAASAGT
jgi:hypothetical protein